MARKVLLADESVAVRKAVEATLEPRDFQIFPVSRGADVIQEAKRIHPDVILLDAGLPDADAYEICRLVKGDPDIMGIPVILMSAEGEGDPAQVREAGAESYLSKPFQGAHLIREVNTVVDLSLEPTMKIEAADMEALDFEDEVDLAPDALELGELELEGDGVLELTEEMETLEEAVREAEELEEFTFEHGGELDLAAPATAPGSGRRIKTEEIEEISFEEELEELELGELELEGSEEIPSLADDLGMAAKGERIISTEELDEGIEFGEELSLTGESPTSEIDLLGTSEDGMPLALEVEEQPPLGASAQPPSKGLVDTDELEEIVLEEDTLDLDVEADETLVTEDLQETSIDFQGEADEGELGQTLEEDGLGDTELSLEEEVSLSEEAQDLQETVMEWEEPREGPEEPLILEETAIDWEDLGEEEAPAPPVREIVEPLPGIAMEPPVAPAVAPMAAKGAVPEPVAAKVVQAPVVGRAPAMPVGLLEEVELEEEIAAVKGEDAWDGDRGGLALEELQLEDVPILQIGLRLDLVEEDFGVVDFFSEGGIRREIARNLQDMVERILADMAPPIVEQVARDIALERTEKIVMEEIERLRLHPEGV